MLHRLPALLASSGHALLCLNAPEIATKALLDQLAECAPGLRFVERIPNPPASTDLDENRSLRVGQAPKQAHIPNRNSAI